MSARLFMLLLLLTYLHFIQTKEKPCKAKRFGYDSVACACDVTYCDSANPQMPSPGEYLIIESNKSGKRFSYKYENYDCTSVNIESQCINIIKEELVILKLDRSRKAQKILGFGSSFTDATGFNLNAMPRKLQDDIIAATYGSKGLRLNMARSTIGHTDFSLSEYYYNDSPYDVDQVNWTLKEADYKYRIPFILKAKVACADEFHLISSLWTVPAWMREKDDFGSRLQVKKKYYKSYALYIIKYLQAFRKEGIEHWGVSYANEPTQNLGVDIIPMASKIFTVWTINRLINFGIDVFVPFLRKSGFNDLNVVFFDDNRFILKSSIVRWIKENSTRTHYIKYAGLHSYDNNQVKSFVVDDFHKSFPHTTIITTEYCAGLEVGLQLGSWGTAEYYAEHMIDEINHYTSSWIDWNLVLDIKGGPQFFGKKIDAPIIVDTGSKTFYKQPSYYAMGHFSKFIPRGSTNVYLKAVLATTLQYAAVERPDGLIVVLVYNKSNKTVPVTIKDKLIGGINIVVSAYSINTVIY